MRAAVRQNSIEINEEGLTPGSFVCFASFFVVCFASFCFYGGYKMFCCVYKLYRYVCKVFDVFAKCFAVLANCFELLANCLLCLQSVGLQNAKCDLFVTCL